MKTICRMPSKPAKIHINNLFTCFDSLRPEVYSHSIVFRRKDRKLCFCFFCTRAISNFSRAMFDRLSPTAETPLELITMFDAHTSIEVELRKTPKSVEHFKPEHGILCFKHEEIKKLLACSDSTLSMIDFRLIDKSG